MKNKDQILELSSILQAITDLDKWEVQYLWAKPGTDEYNHYSDQMLCKLVDANLSNDPVKIKELLTEIMDAGDGMKWRLVSVPTGNIRHADKMYTRIRKALV